MYYVFYMNDGYALAMSTPSLNAAFADLNAEIQEKTGIPPRDQILLLGGGETLRGEFQLSQYPDAGTEHNPVYLIKRTARRKDPINSREAEGIANVVGSWRRELAALAEQTPKPQLVGQYVGLAENSIRVAEKLCLYIGKVCDEHHYLKNGWMSVVQNMEKYTDRMTERYHKCNRTAKQLPKLRQTIETFVRDFSLSLDAMEKIHLPAELLIKSRSDSGSSTVSSVAANSPDTQTLYDWLDSRDPHHAVEDLIEHVQKHMALLDNADVHNAGKKLRTIKSRLSNLELRNIGGIDKRINGMEVNRQGVERTLIEFREGTVTAVISATGTYREAINRQRQLLPGVAEMLDRFAEFANHFLRSKMEVLEHVRNRLASWVKESYEQLASAQSELLMFDEKVSAFRKRYELARQVRDAPQIFVAAVAECVRRSAFRREFTAWLGLYAEKAAAFVREENTTRAELYCKLEKHFLRDLFGGLSDELPNITPPEKAFKFDSRLPGVDATHLRALRNAFKDEPELQELCKVQTPSVFGRLFVDDPSQPIVSARQIEEHAALRREDSFFVKDSPKAIRSRFPSATWLTSAEMSTDMSPSTSNQLYLSRVGGSSSSLNSELSSAQLASPTDLSSNVEFGRPILRRTGSAASREFTPSSVDLSSPTSIHPERHGSARRISSQISHERMDEFDENEEETLVASRADSEATIDDGTTAKERPVFHVAESDASLSRLNDDSSSTATPPLYTPLLSPSGLQSAPALEPSSTAAAIPIKRPGVAASRGSSVVAEFQFGTPESPREAIGRASMSPATLGRVQRPARTVADAETQTAQLESEEMSTSTDADTSFATCDMSTSVEEPNTVADAETSTSTVYLDAESDTEEHITTVERGTDAEPTVVAENRDVETETQQIELAEFGTDAEPKTETAEKEIQSDELTESVETAEKAAQWEAEESSEAKETTEIGIQTEEAERLTSDAATEPDQSIYSATSTEFIVATADCGVGTELQFAEAHTQIHREYREVDSQTNLKVQTDSETQCHVVTVDAEVQWDQRGIEAEIQTDKIETQTEKTDASTEATEWREFAEAAVSTVAETVEAISETDAVLTASFGIQSAPETGEVGVNTTETEPFEITEKRIRDEYEMKIQQLQDQLRQAEEDKATLAAAVVASAQPAVMGTSFMTAASNSPPPTLSPAMVESCTVLSPAAAAAFAEAEKAEEAEEAFVVDEDSQQQKDVASHSAQTSVRMGDFDFLINIGKHIRSGDAVMLQYSDALECFTVFTTGPISYFVKQRSMRRFGFDNMAALPSPIFARVSSIELCETKRNSNRYKLERGTRFCRVELHPLGLSSDADEPATSRDQ